MGDSRQHLIDALSELSAAAVGIDDVSALYETDPVGDVAQDNFLNIAVTGLTEHPPLDLLNACQAIEAAHQRERLIHWGPRTLDIDLLALEQPFDHPRLSLPHPEMHKRDFVLRPMLDLDSRPALDLPYPIELTDDVRLLESKGWHRT